ncbi:MAG: FAD-linked oxidase [Deltaproteobacteria bacterium CG11_big_fil_rev_8_21_14_0_20_47_16]|nr:MAG: FAD-linked oxidase [Deltaproteobacteria bacterium CG11_big_fil_rev_8_21_14_0_20_47_16]
MKTLQDQHNDTVAKIATEIQARIIDNQPVHIAKGGVSHFVPLPGDRRFKGMPIDISTLKNVLRVDVKSRTCTAEPGVTFAELVKITMAHGLIPAVVPELEGITIGGAVAGCSVESMSYKYGGFHDTCLEYEVITGEGKILRCSREQDAHAFEMIHGSYGTLGVLTQLTFKLLPAKPFVKMEYRKFDNFEAFRAEMRERCTIGDYEFVDGIIHDRSTFVICLGRFVDHAPYISNYRWLNIFYKSTAELKEDYLTTFDYCFRYDTECHWITKTIPMLETKPARFALGKFILGSTNIIKWSKRIEQILKFKKRPDVVVDVFIPEKRFGDFYNWYESEFDFFPLWVIPYRMPKIYGWISDEHASNMGDALFIDCAVYGKPNAHPTIDYSEILERKTTEFGGIKTLISRNHYTKDEFWKIYHQKNYNKAKLQLDPKGVFPQLYDKFLRP